jgi:hypothetical protein
MIVAEMNGAFYRCISAFLENADERIECTVTTAEEVAAFLKTYPDQFFSLVPGLIESLEGQTPEEDVVWCWCGLVKWQWTEATLHSKRFKFEEAGLSEADLEISGLLCPSNA